MDDAFSYTTELLVFAAAAASAAASTIALEKQMKCSA